MAVDPLEIIDSAVQEDIKTSEQETQKNRLNTLVVITVALLATFMGVCKVKDDNIVQAMQQAQADKIDNWNFYQARNLREEISKATIVQLQLQQSSQPPTARLLYAKQIAMSERQVKDQNRKKAALKLAAENDQKTYDQLNYHDDQFDLSDAAISIAISLLAITSLTQKRTLYAVALIPTILGVVMGLAGLMSWNIHPDALTRLLSQTSPNPGSPSKIKLATNQVIDIFIT